MENRANPFYELYDRLYAAAAAGTAVIAEDFRLKRAIDAFEPLAQKNKVFARLHTMCAALPTSSNAASDIVDCIALAEALAVTQGIFLDSSETKPAKVGGFAPHNIPYSQLTELKDSINKAKNSPKDFPADLAKYADDPRLVSAFIENCDTNSENFGELANVFISKCGSALAEPLFESIDLNDPKATGRQIEFIAQIAGSGYAERFRQLAFDENAPAGVRVRAVTALSLSEEYSDDIIELYRTSSGKVNIAALEAIARLSPPEGEAIFEKLAEKFKAAYINAFSIAKYRVCSQYARTALEKWMKEKPENSEPAAIACILCKKTDIYDCLDKLSQRAQKCYSYKSLLVDILLHNITNSCDRLFTDMIEQLYRRYPSEVLFAKIVSDILLKRSDTFELEPGFVENNLETILSLLDQVKTDNGCYRLRRYKRDGYPEVGDPVLFDRVPEELLKLIVDAPLGKNSKGQPWCMMIHRFVNACLPADRDRVITTAVNFALRCTKLSPNKAAITLLDEFYYVPDGAVCTLIISELKAFGKVPYVYYYSGGHNGNTDKALQELKRAETAVKNMKNELSEQVFNSALSDINRYISDLEKRKE